MKKLVFVDAETTGLDPAKDQLVELTYAVENAEPKTLYFGVETVPEFIDNLIGFTERGIAGKKSTPAEFREFTDACIGQTMVAANPSFDKAFLEANNLFVFHYRMLDIESYAFAAMKVDHVPGMKEIQELLSAEGYIITEPDHTSRNDVLALRESYYALKARW